MKKLLIMSIALVAIMATVLTVSAFAANTVTIDSVTLSKYGSADTFNDAYANVTVNYTVTEDTAGAVDRLTFYLAAQDLSSALEGEEAKVIYIDEQVKPETGSFTFVIEKDRVRTAFTATGDITTDVVKNAYVELNTYSDKADQSESPFVMTFKLGGTDVDTAADYAIVFKNPTMFGDVTGDGKMNIQDTLKIARHASQKALLTEGSEEFYRADLTGDGKINIQDTLRLFRYASQKSTYAEILAARTNW